MLFGYFFLLLYIIGVLTNIIYEGLANLPLSECSNYFDIFIASIVPLKIYPNADICKQEIFKDNNKKSGIYRWVNNVNGKTYVGSAIDLKNRLTRYYNYKHIASQRSNMLIHKALLKYGYSNFSLEILEYCDTKQRQKVLNREQYYLDLLNPEYNILKNTRSSIGYKHSLKAIDKIKEIQLKIHESLEHLEKKILANSNSIKIKLTNVNTNEDYLFNSIRDASRKIAVIEGISKHSAKNRLLQCIKDDCLFLDKYKITKINTKKED